MTTLEVLQTNNHINALLSNLVVEEDRMARKSYSENIANEVLKLCTALIEDSHEPEPELRVM